MFLTVISIILFLISVIGALVLGLTAGQLGLVPLKLVLVAIGILLLVSLLSALICGIGRRKKQIVPRIIGLVLLVLMCIIEGAGYYYLSTTQRTLKELTAEKAQVAMIGVFVRAEDPAQNMQEVLDIGYRFAVAGGADVDRVAQTRAEIEQHYGKTMDVREYPTVPEAIDALYTGEVDAMLMNEAYLEAVAAAGSYTDYPDRLRKLDTWEVEKPAAPSEQLAAPASKDQPFTSVSGSGNFCIYLSGADTVGPVTKLANSDANVLCIVNESTRTILLLFTPRDFYLPFTMVNGARDKLTHSGLYGIDVSVDTLSNCYDIPIDYYVRMNFSGFETVIDRLGGVDVESDANFGSEKYFYHEGTNHLNGEAALLFARNRIAFLEGDRARGRHQMAVVRGVIQGISSSQMLLNYRDILTDLASCFQTNIPMDLIGELVQITLEDRNWNIVSYSVNGSDAHELCNTIQLYAYVMPPYEDTVEYAKDLIHHVWQGDSLTQSIIDSGAPQH